GEFLDSLGVVEKLGARLCLAGHGRTFTDVHAHIQGNRKLVEERLASVLAAVRDAQLSAFEVVPHVYGTALSTDNAHWLLSKILGYLTHLEARGEVRRIPGEPERWTA
ncbi:MAG TPA: MBL fold metallo-hydrolase, partial [Solirubrobacteraceae bacterium]|nr:MBL fold metallo-hydrolase [Solirubrobacteraceae bacterium]